MLARSGAGKGEWVRRALVLCLVGLGGCVFVASAPATITFDFPTSVYVTTYSGNYDLSIDNEFAGPLEAGGYGRDTEHYNWVTTETDAFTPLEGRRFKEKISRTTEGYGYDDSSSKLPDSDPAPGSQKPIDINCNITSDPELTESATMFGHTGKARSNPLLEVDWGIPYVTGSNGLDEVCSVAGGQTVTSPPGSGVLRYTSAIGLAQQSHSSYFAGNPECGLYLEPTPSFFDAWGNGASEGTDHGTALVPFRTLPYKRTFNIQLGPKSVSCSEGTSTAQLTVSSKLWFGLDQSTSKAPPNKTGNLFLRDGLSILSFGTNTTPLSPAPVADQTLSTGQSVPVLYPGMPVDGTATMDVTGLVLPPTHDVRAHALHLRSRTARAHAVTLFTGKMSDKDHRAFVVMLRPTAAGRITLRSAHRALKVRVTARFKPTGKAKAFSVTESINLPATSS
jgi:hypothetical protein